MTDLVNGSAIVVRIDYYAEHIQIHLRITDTAPGKSLVAIPADGIPGPVWVAMAEPGRKFRIRWDGNNEDSIEWGDL